MLKIYNYFFLTKLISKSNWRIGNNNLMLIIKLNIRDLRKELRVFILNNLKKLSLQIKSKKMNGYVKDKIVKQSTKLI
jgi:hypothetical protein